VPAAQLGSFQAAQLAVMLPAPKRFEKRRDSGYLNSRASTIQARMGAIELP
jgi:monofunctional biosynthetic peptidoglycan transglycosylase